MTNNLKHQQEKIQEKRKKTPWRKFLMEIVSLRSLSLYNHDGMPSVFPDAGRVLGIIPHELFSSTRDSLTKSGLPIQAGKSFFEQFNELWFSVKFPPTILFGTCENTEYTDQTVSCKNSYLSYVVIHDCENVLYSVSVKERSKNVLNSLMVRDNCENIFHGKSVIHSFNVFYSHFIKNSSNIWFSSNLIGCSECLMCEGLSNQSYCIQNKQYTKEEYRVRKEAILKHKEKFTQRYSGISHVGANIACDKLNVGHSNVECQDIKNGYLNYQISEGRNLMLIGGKEPGERIYDAFLHTPTETDIYGVFSTGFGSHIYCSYQIKGGANIYYSVILEDCSYCVGCVGLINKSYCIFNKQYTKEAWHEAVALLFHDMDQQGILGEFFPGSLNPFYFNDTAAYLIDDTFTKEEVEAAGYLRRDEEIRVDIPEGVEIVTLDQLDQYEGFNSQGEREISPDIIKKVIQDEVGNYYRVIPKEYKFLKKYALPLPRNHWLQRMKYNFTLS